MVLTALQAAELLAVEGIEVTLVNARFVKPLDKTIILPLTGNSRIFTVEDNALSGGFGSALLELFEEEGLSPDSVTRIGYPDSFIEQGEQTELYQRYGLTPGAVAATIKSALS
jgi:1-deoxy-D-xylulose-5-phosphate synthase